MAPAIAILISESVGCGGWSLIYTSLFCSSVDTAWPVPPRAAAVEWWAWWRPADDGNVVCLNLNSSTRCNGNDVIMVHGHMAMVQH